MTTPLGSWSDWVLELAAHRTALRAELARVDRLLTGGAGHGRAPKQTGPSDGADAGVEAAGVPLQPAPLMSRLGPPEADVDRLYNELHDRNRAALRIDSTRRKIEERLSRVLNAIQMGLPDIAGALATNQAHDARYLAWVEAKIR